MANAIDVREIPLKSYLAKSLVDLYCLDEMDLPSAVENDPLEGSIDDVMDALAGKETLLEMINGFARKIASGIVIMSEVLEAGKPVAFPVSRGPGLYSQIRYPYPDNPAYYQNKIEESLDLLQGISDFRYEVESRNPT